MKKILALSILVWVLLPGAALAFLSFIKMNADALRKDPSLKIRVFKSGDQVAFRVALRKSEDPEAVPYASLGLVDPKGVEVGDFALRGEDIRGVNLEALRAWGWENMKSAEVFCFTVHSNLLTRSQFSWQHGPPYDKHGVPIPGGVIFSCHLKDLADAAENAAEKTNEPLHSTPR